VPEKSMSDSAFVSVGDQKPPDHLPLRETLPPELYARVQALKDLEIGPDPVLAAFAPAANGLLDDHYESWFLSETQLPGTLPEGMESVVNLGQSQEWLAPPVPISDDVSVGPEPVPR